MGRKKKTEREKKVSKLNLDQAFYRFSIRSEAVLNEKPTKKNFNDYINAAWDEYRQTRKKAQKGGVKLRPLEDKGAFALNLVFETVYSAHPTNYKTYMEKYSKENVRLYSTESAEAIARRYYINIYGEEKLNTKYGKLAIRNLTKKVMKGLTGRKENKFGLSANYQQFREYDEGGGYHVASGGLTFFDLLYELYGDKYALVSSEDARFMLINGHHPRSNIDDEDNEYNNYKFTREEIKLAEQIYGINKK